jgi:Mg-chelatase subunit ChlD
MKQDYTHILIVLDASGSMSCIQNDIKGSFNAFLNKQREEPGKTVFDLYQFNDEAVRLVKSADLAQFHDDLMSRYECTGCTALNDAVCIAMDTIGQEFANMPEEERPANVLCVIITDGEENASRKFTAKDVKDRIEHQKTKYNWEFVYLAADQDAFAAGEALGITLEDRTLVKRSTAGVAKMCCMMEDRADRIRKRPKK